MKSKYVFFFLLSLHILGIVPFLLRPAIYAVIPVAQAEQAAFPTPTLKTLPRSIFEPENGVIADISNTADALVLQYGSKPPYHGQTFAAGTHLTPEEAIATAPYILSCESENTDGNSCGIDTNGKPSCGRAQFQDWGAFWEKASDIQGDPLNGNDAIRMLLWGLEHGYISRWSCAGILKIVQNPL